METLFKERKLLRKIIRLTHKSTMQSVYPNKLGIEFNNFYLNELLSKELLSVHHVNNGPEPNSGIKSIRLTEAGLHFFEFKRERLINFLMRSVATPIIVSALTTGLIWLIRWLI